MNYEHETKIEMHFNYNGDYYCLYGLYSAKDPVDNSDDSGTKKKSFGKYDIMKDGVKVIIPEMKNMYM